MNRAKILEYARVCVCGEREQDYGVLEDRSKFDLGPAEGEPLTLEDLRAMDGQPVWAEKPGHESRWALVYSFWRTESVVFLIFNNGKQEHAKFLLDEGWKIYRHPPRIKGGTIG